MTTQVQSNPVSATSRRMPKEQLPDVMTLRLREGTFDRIDKLCAENKRAEWIRDAIEAELKRRERTKPKATPDA